MKKVLVIRTRSEDYVFTGSEKEITEQVLQGAAFGLYSLRTAKAALKRLRIR